MKKFKKLFLSAAMLSALCAMGTGLLTSHAEEETPVEEQPSLTENFIFEEDFDYGDGTLTSGSGSNHSYTAATSDAYAVSIEKEGDDEYFKASVNNDSKVSTPSASFRFAPNGGTNSVISLTGENNTVVFKTRFKVLSQDRKFIRLYMAGKNYDILNIFSNNVYYTINNTTSYNETTNPNYEVFAASTPTNTWCDLTVIIQDNGLVDADGNSPDTITAFLNGKYLYTKNFEKNSDFTGSVGHLYYWFASANRDVDGWCIDYLRFGQYNAPVATAPEVVDAKVNIPFDLVPTFTGTDSTYLPSIVPSYDVSFTLNEETLTSENSGGMVVYKNEAGDSIIGYENGKYIGLSAVEGLTATFTFENNMATSVSTTFGIEANDEDIPVVDIATQFVQKQDNVFTLGLNEQLDLSKLFKATPSTATNPELEFVVSDETILDIDNGILTALASGTATLTITAPGGEDVSKVVTINVVDNPTYDTLNNFAVGDTWTAVTTQALNDYRGKAYNGKTFAPIEVVEDDFFGSAIKFTGTGAANSSGSYLLMPVNSYESYGTTHFATDGGTYVLSGWVKADITTGTTGRVEIKVYDYQRYLGSSGSYSYYNGSQDPLYYTNLTINISDMGDGWTYFETNPICYDPNAVDAAFNGLKIELGVYNTMEGVDFYLSHLNFVEQETITTGWELIDEDWQYIDDTAISVTTGTTYQIYATPLPSYGEINAVFSSSDETIATVDQNGLVTFLDKTGNVEILVTNGDWPSKTITFNVKLVATSITLPEDKDTIEISISQRYEIVDVIITPADAQSTYTVTAEDGTVCLVDFANGQLQIVPQKIGTTTVTIVANDNPDATLTFTVHIKGYSITYNTNGHGETPETLVDVTALPVDMVELTEEGFIFLGWYFDADCTQVAEAGTAISADTTLYAKWVSADHPTFTITYNTNGHGDAPEALTEQIIIQATALPTLTAEGWTFGGWFLDAECTQAVEEGAELTADVTLYAKWTEVVVEEPENPTDPSDPEEPTDPEQPEQPGGEEPTTPEEPKSGVNVVAIVVPIVVVVVLAAAGALVYFFVFRKKESNHKE